VEHVGFIRPMNEGIGKQRHAYDAILPCRRRWLMNNEMNVVIRGIVFDEMVQCVLMCEFLHWIRGEGCGRDE
jgi:hypothetical protein